MNDITGNIIDTTLTVGRWIAALPPRQLAALCATVAVAALISGSRRAAKRRRPKRLFDNPDDRRRMFAAAGGRCEHSRLGIRCRADAAEVDHIQPWAAGGATTLVNAQVLCRTHNQRKGAAVPSRFYLWRLRRRRRRYRPSWNPRLRRRNMLR